MNILEERKKADRLLRREILQILSESADIDITDVDLFVDDGVVTLFGSVDSLYEKMTIEYYVARLLSVAEVENKIEVNRHREGSVEASLSGQDNLILKAPE